MTNPEPAPALRASLLSTEHWGLLAARGTAQSEVLSRIGMFLTLVSAGLVSLALLGQLTAFRAPFPLLAIGVLAFVTVVGVLTQVRVQNVGQEDLMYVLAMNRIRGAYLSLDGGIAPYLMASSHDDQEGSARTYFFLGRRSPFNQLAGSTAMFILVINAALVGLLAAGIGAAAAAPAALTVALGLVTGLVYFAVLFWLVARSYFRFWKGYAPLDPTRQGVEPAPSDGDLDA
ncbi:MAG: hypothetical protein QOC59_857 [Microbacteriaceae bacterium]|jgi:hypothetical protein|nr:hypothetical protein [Microbacteriaceae bacterium]